MQVVLQATAQNTTVSVVAKSHPSLLNAKGSDRTPSPSSMLNMCEAVEKLEECVFESVLVSASTDGSNRAVVSLISISKIVRKSNNFGLNQTSSLHKLIV